MKLLGGEPGPGLVPLGLEPLIDLARIRRSPADRESQFTQLLRKALSGNP